MVAFMVLLGALAPASLAAANQTISDFNRGSPEAAFRCQSRDPGPYKVHLENRPGQRSNLQTFRVGNAATRIALPIPEFSPFAGSATTIVWSKVDPRPGQQFSLVLDDVLVVK